MKKELLAWLKIIVFSLIIAIASTYLINPIIIKNYSMSPTIEENDIILIYRFLNRRKNLSKGDIVVFKSSLKNLDGTYKILIKRVIAIAGETIVISDGKVFVNDQPLEENYLRLSYTEGNITMMIPENSIFVMGDNRGKSLDSRDFDVGLVDVDLVLGKAIIRIYPFNKISLMN